DLWCYSAACLCWALIVVGSGERGVFEGSGRGGVELKMLFMAMVTIGLFAGACWHVMKVLKEPAAETEKTTAAGGEKDV
ncbi:MAG: hypothetical protein MK138_11245, partial [Planctomycetes bacterium]|nr:hypothetical protein [Planctomycetota bacterium]